MNYRQLTDPHQPNYEWHVVNGIREWRFNDGMISCPWCQVDDELFMHTPERLTLWADLTLQPFEP